MITFLLPLLTAFPINAIEAYLVRVFGAFALAPSTTATGLPVAAVAYRFGVRLYSVDATLEDPRTGTAVLYLRVMLQEEVIYVRYGAVIYALR